MKVVKGVNIPDSMKALVLHEYGEEMKLEERKVPTPKNNEVLIKVSYSPVNPSDLSWLNGNYSSQKKLPSTPGFEGSGVVVDSGNNFMSKRLLGKKVAFFAQSDGEGSWAEYLVTTNTLAVPLISNLDLKVGSTMLINPMSVMAMVDIALKSRAKAIANTAAASKLGQFMVEISKTKGLELVNIVRKESQAELLKSKGAKHIINTSNPNYKKEMKETFEKLGVSIAFDAVAGELAGDLMETMPSGTEVIVYGGLSAQNIPAGPISLIFEDKTLKGFWLSKWVANQSILKLLKTFKEIQRHLVNQRFDESEYTLTSLENANEAIKKYSKEMTGAKVLIAL